MAQYRVDKNAQSTPGREHEVHVVSCTSPHMPAPHNRVELGEHSTCQSAVQAAKAHYSNVDGCYYCSCPCHTR